MRILGRFAYNAITVKPGLRKPRRDVLFGVMVYDIAEISSAEAVSDAIVYEDILGHEKRLLGWDGRLWSPMRLNGDRGPTTIADLQASCQVVFPIGFGTDNPIANGYFNLRNYGPTDLTFGDGLRDRDEATFAGQVVSDERALAIRRFTEMSRKVILVDGAPYACRSEPHWRLNSSIPCIAMTDVPLSAQSTGFRLDRLDDIRAYARETHHQHEYQFVPPSGARRGYNRPIRRETANPEALSVRGRLIAADPDFLVRDDLSHFFNAIARSLIDGKFTEILPFMPPEATDIWRRHVVHVMQRSSDDDAPYAVPTGVALDEFTSLARMLAEAKVPACWDTAQEDLLRGPYRILSEHLAFEARCGRLPKLTPDDHEAIASIAV